MSQNQNPVEQVDRATDKIQELIRKKFTGSITVNYRFKEGRLLAVNLLTEEKITENIKILDFK